MTFMLRYATSLFFLLVTCFAIAQITPRPKAVEATPIATDSIVYKTTYGLRVGIEASSIARTAIG